MARYIVSAGWSHSPHLDEDEMKAIRDSTPPHLIEARSEGKPTLGSGSVYPLNEKHFVVENLVPKPEWRMVYALDVGWNATAAVWLAHDTNADVVYVYDCYKQGKREPDVHATHIRMRDPENIRLRGVIDPAAHGSNQRDGAQLIKLYRKAGLDVIPAENNVESGIAEVWARLSSGRLKVIWNSNTEELLKEYRKYRRDEKGRIVKKDDHLMDCLRYGVVSGLRYAKSPLFVRNTGRRIAGARDYGI